MHLELVVPALFGATTPMPALELLLARGRKRKSEPRDPGTWLAAAFGLPELSLPAGALSALAAGQDPGAVSWLRADPVHLRADRDRLLLIPSPGFALSEDESRRLAASLNRRFAGDLEFHVVAPDAWALRPAKPMPIAAQPPLALAGRDLDSILPDKRWHPLLTEIQMALYEDAVNTEREARGDPAVNSVWFWGAGALPAKAAAPWNSLSAGDPAALGLARLAGMRHRAPGSGAEEWLGRAPEDGRHLIILSGTEPLEERWFAPLLAALRAQRVGMLTLHVPDAGAAFEVVRGDLRRFWRRARPLGFYHSRAP